MSQFLVGQRWICEAELDKGLGTVLKVDGRTVTIIFLASGEKRTYSQQTAPLRRARFAPGDTIENHEGDKLKITAVEENNGIFTYRGIDQSGNQTSLAEGELSNNIQVNRPIDRILSGQTDENGLNAYSINEPWQTLPLPVCTTVEPACCHISFI